MTDSSTPAGQAGRFAEEAILADARAIDGLSKLQVRAYTCMHNCVCLRVRAHVCVALV